VPPTWGFTENNDVNNRKFHVDMLGARILQIIAPEKEYQSYMNEVFAKCIAGLEDSVF
jgi:hypothetical protein